VRRFVPKTGVASAGLSSWELELAGIQNIEGKDLRHAVDPAVFPLENGRRYEMLVAIGRVGPDGVLYNSANAVDGMINTSRLAVGSYEIVLSRPGAFAEDNAFASVQVQIFDPDTMHLNVAVNDVEHSGTNMGVPTDAGFAIALYDGRAAHQADLKIGRGRELSTMRGDDLYRADAAGQRLRFKKVPRRGVRYFHAVENDGNVTDRLVLQAKDRGRGLRVRHRRLAGGAANVTAALRSSGLELPTLAPGENLRFETRLRFRGSDHARSARVTARANSFSGGQPDASRATALRSR